MAVTLTSTNTTLTGSYNQDSLVETVNNHSYYAAVFGPGGQDFTVTNQGEITAPGTGRYVDGILLAALGTVINQGTIIVDGGDGIQLQAGGAATNSGVIEAVAIGISSTSGYVLNAGTITSQTGINLTTGTVRNTGLISAGTANGAGIVLADGGSAFNTGTITGQQGILMASTSDAPDYINNRGTISVKALAEELGKSGISVNDGVIISTGGDGIDLTAGGTVLNSGLISATRFAISAGQYLSLSNLGTIAGPITAATAGIFNDGTILGVIRTTGAASLTNYGIIAGTNSFISFASGAVFNTGVIDDSINFATGTANVFNTGLIQALQQTGVNLFGGTVDNLGMIRGNAGIQAAATATVANAGTIDAYTAYGVLLRGGGNVSNTGVIQAKTYGIGARQRATITNGGDISSATGDGILLRTGGAVTNTGTISALAAISIIGTAAIVNDATILGNIITTGITSLDNNGLITALPGGTGASYVDLASGNLINTGAIMEAVDFTTGPGTIANVGLLSAVSAASSLALTNLGTISGNILAATGVITNDSTILGNISTTGTMSLSNFGTISATGGGLYLGGGIVLNSATIAGQVEMSGGGSVTNFGLVTDVSGIGIQLYAGGSAVNFGTILANRYGIDLKTGGTATNQGYIHAIYAGIDSGYPGSLTTYATISNSGQISGGEFGIKFDAGTVTNTGTLSHVHFGILNIAGGSVNNAGLIDANANINSGDAVVSLNGCTFTNTGTLIGNSGIYFGGGVITNSGIIQGTGTNSNGIAIIGGASSIQNTGTITADTGIKSIGAPTITNAAGATIAGTTLGIDLLAAGTITNLGLISGASAAVELATGSTLTNDGTITGATAIYFAASAADRLIISPTSTITGSINGGGGVLELAATTIAGTFTAAEQTQFANFASLQVDQGATWDFSGTQALAAAALTNNGTIVQSTHTTLTIDGAITGAGTIKLAAGALVLENTVASQQTIDFTGTGEDLELANPSHFNGIIGKFAAGDTIDLTSISLSSITATHFVHSVLTIAEAGTKLFFTFANPGTFAHETFALSRAGHGTDITLASAAAVHPPITPIPTLAPLTTFA